MIIPWPDVHRLVIVQEVKGERQDSIFALVVQVERRGAAKRRQQRVAGKCAGSQIEKPLGQLEWLRTVVGIKAKDEVGLYVGDVTQNQVHVVGYLANFVHSLQGAGLRLAPQIEP